MRFRNRAGFCVPAVLLAILSSVDLRADDVLAELQSKGLNPGETQGWVVRKDLLGLPYVLVEKGDAKSFRTNISLAHLGKSPREIPASVFTDDPSAYEEGRKLYLQQRGGELLGFASPEHRKPDARTRVHAFGYEYRLGDEAFHEESHYLFCTSGSVWLLKGVSTTQEKQRKELKRVLAGFSCGN